MSAPVKIATAFLSCSFVLFSLNIQAGEPRVETKVETQKPESQTIFLEHNMLLQQSQDPTNAVPLTAEEQKAADLKMAELKEAELKAAEMKELGYKVVYSKQSIKKPDLNNKKIKGQIYRYQSPYQKFEVKTDELGQFLLDKKLDKNVAISLFYIEGQEKSNVRCNGNALPGKKEITVYCE
ncbi:hypothetical protein CC99x_009760 [Candidatus Berkiella cookevillensis]|uniref:Pilus assembly protein, PilP n=1 Tax=Candidatus Berkiella cookevillensis TaxID=437022 RepID=A0A0Q9YNP7_9GAMM|nr:hypothetical protein [Candidatus Berkiella cookevillensis]MCS5709190.1 hypothetical protein [Candidatus Berkiella cookevillensis]